MDGARRNFCHLRGHWPTVTLVLHDSIQLPRRASRSNHITKRHAHHHRRHAQYSIVTSYQNNTVRIATTMATETDEENSAAPAIEIVPISERPNAMHQRVQHSSFRSLGTENAPDEGRGKRAKALSTRDAMGSKARRQNHLKNAISPLRKRRVRWRSNVERRR